MKYQAKYNNQVEKFRATDYCAFGSFVTSCLLAKVPAEYFIDGKQVSAEDALNAVDNEKKAWFDKKSETHKQITVSKGATTLGNTYHRIWVRK